MSVLLYILSQKVYKISYQWNKILVISINFILGFIISEVFRYYIFPSNQLLTIIIDIIIFLIVIGILSYFKVIEISNLKEIFKL